MIKILTENTGKLIKEFEYDNETFYLCDINEHEYKMMLLRGSVVGVDDIMVEYVTLVNLINKLFNEGFTHEEMNEELGAEFVEYRNRLFGETYKSIKDEPKNTRIKAGIIYVINQSKV